MKEVIDELMAKFDTDGDGGVSYNEFAEFVKPKNVVDLTNVADHNNRGVGYFDAEHAAKIKKAAPLKPVKEATAAELEGYRAKLAEKIDEVQAKRRARSATSTPTTRGICPSRRSSTPCTTSTSVRARAMARPYELPNPPLSPALLPPSLTALPLPCRHPEGARRPADRQGRRHRPRRQDRVADEFAKLCHALEAEDIGGQAVAPHDASIEAGEFSWDDPMHAGNAHLHLHRHPGAPLERRGREGAHGPGEGRGGGTRGPRIQRVCEEDQILCGRM